MTSLRARERTAKALLVGNVVLVTYLAIVIARSETDEALKWLLVAVLVGAGFLSSRRAIARSPQLDISAQGLVYRRRGIFRSAATTSIEGHAIGCFTIGDGGGWVRLFGYYLAVFGSADEERPTWIFRMYGSVPDQAGLRSQLRASGYSECAR